MSIVARSKAIVVVVVADVGVRVVVAVVVVQGAVVASECVVVGAVFSFFGPALVLLAVVLWSGIGCCCCRRC